MNRKIISFFIFVLLFGGLFLPSVKASSTVQITDTLWYKTGKYEFQNFDYVSCVLSNGYFVFAYINNANSELIRIKVYTGAGILYGSVDWQTSSTYLNRDVVLYRISDTQIVIMFEQEYLSGTRYFRHGAFIFNPIALSSGTAYYNTAQAMSTSGCNVIYTYFTDILLYNAVYYSICSTTAYDSSNGYKYWIDLIDFTGSAVVRTELQVDEAFGASKSAWVPYWFVHPTDDAYAYAMYGSTGTAISYYTINLAGKSATLIAGMFDSAYTVDNSQAVNSHFIAGGLEVNGTYSYLYFSWIQSGIYTTAPKWTYINDRMQFNATTPSSATFKMHMSYAHEIFSGVYTGISVPYWFYGYQVDESHVYIYYPSNTVGGQVLATRHYLTLSDRFDNSTYSWSYVTQYPTTDNIPVQNAKPYPVQFYFTSQFALGYDGTHILLYYGLSTFTAVYTATVSYLPYDTPNLEMNEQYTFTVTAYKNGVIMQGLNIKFFSNTVEQFPAYKATNSLGKVSYLVTFNQAGAYLFTWEVFDPYSMYPTTIQYTLENTYIISYIPPPSGGDSEGITSGFLTGSGSALIVKFLPAFIVLIVPVGLFIPFGGAGVVLGLGMGVIMGIITGVVPFYVLFIIILLIAIALVMVFRSGISGTAKAEG